MTCRTLGGAGIRHHDHLLRPAHAGGRRSWTVDETVELVARVAAFVPRPGSALDADEPSWRAFAEVLRTGAGLVAAAVGHDEILLRRALLCPRVGLDPVRMKVLELALELLL